MGTAKVLFLIAAVLLINLGSVLAEEGSVKEMLSQDVKESDVQWVWGEVINVDSKNGTLSAKYLDYEDSREKDIAFSVDSNTVYEGIKSLEDVKLKDFLSIDYIITEDGSNLARNISMDKPKEDQPAMQTDTGAVNQRVIDSGAEMSDEPGSAETGASMAIEEPIEVKIQDSETAE